MKENTFWLCILSEMFVFNKIKRGEKKPFCEEFIYFCSIKNGELSVKENVRNKLKIMNRFWSISPVRNVLHVAAELNPVYLIKL